MVNAPMRGRHSCTSSGTYNAFKQPKISFYHEAPPRTLPFGVAGVGAGVVVCCYWAFIFSPSVLSFPLKIIHWFFFFWYFKFNPYSFDLNFFSWLFCIRFYFSISSFNLSLSYIIFSIWSSLFWFFLFFQFLP